jgi:hypothetical protein
MHRRRELRPKIRLFFLDVEQIVFQRRKGTALDWEWRRRISQDVWFLERRLQPLSAECRGFVVSQPLRRTLFLQRCGLQDTKTVRISCSRLTPEPSAVLSCRLLFSSLLRRTRLPIKRIYRTFPPEAVRYCSPCVPHWREPWQSVAQHLQFVLALIPGQPIVDGRCAFLEVIA